MMLTATSIPEEHEPTTPGPTSPTVAKPPTPATATASLFTRLQIPDRPRRNTISGSSESPSPVLDQSDESTSSSSSSSVSSVECAGRSRSYSSHDLNYTSRPNRAKSPSFSLLYPDTAPRGTWRPQLDAWMKKNHPAKLKEIAQTAAPPRVHHTNNAINDPLTTVTTATTTTNSTTNASTNTNKDYHPNPPTHGQRRASFHENSKPYARPLNHHHQPSPVAESLPDSAPSLPTTPPLSPELATSHSHSSSHKYSDSRRRCISCGSDQSPCWRPSWSPTAGQLCNSCGLRYKKTGARCVSKECGRIPAKGEWVTMKRNAIAQSASTGKLLYLCLNCGGRVEVNESV
ncbi:hypothetical protein TRVA0_008S03070 [Trichomonascus vanleenenianus]|uniref:DNA-binding transcription repressor ASH1 n=1 Tax=Trichomonascus vanleenenianus TaxID=2268995 RepID=UPI003ECB71F4